MQKKRSFIIAGIAGGVLVVGLFAGSMAVQAWGPGKWMGRGFHGCGFHHGFGGGKGVVDFILWRMDETVKDLGLNGSQKEKYEKLRAGIKSHGAAAIEDHLALREDIHNEMAKDVPDIGVVAPKLKTTIGQISTDMQNNIDLFAAFYNSLDNNQKKKVLADVRERMEHSGR